jgi:hypothetical protein
VYKVIRLPAAPAIAAPAGAAPAIVTSATAAPEGAFP